MLSINRATILGNLTRDPEVRYTPNGQAVANFGVATNRRWKNPTGEMQEATEFHDVVAWGKLAEQISQMIKKGSPVYVEGRLQTRSWEAPDGTKRYRTEIVAQVISALGPRTAGAAELEATRLSPTAESPPLTDQATAPDDSPSDQTIDKKSKSRPNPTESVKDEEINLDEIPF